MLTSLTPVICFPFKLAENNSGSIGDIGTDLTIYRNMTDQFEARTRERFFINLKNSASTDGIVSGLEYCYFIPSPNNNDTFQATVAIYRNATTSGQYTLIPNTTTILRGEPQALSGNQLSCTSHNLSSGVMVRRGDVLAACVYDSDDIKPLNVVARSSSLLDSEVREADGSFCLRPCQLQQSFTGDDLDDQTSDSLLISAPIFGSRC